jgi:crotonobetainyl-CoA:carnitine CoA-transferase CaiB-like acyl-CoA transferase
VNYLARSGLLGFQGPAGGAPQVPAFQLADVSGGMWCVIAILAALAERARTGQGAVLDVAMTDGVLGFASAALGPILGGADHRRGAEPLSGGIAPYNTYETKDGRWMSLGALEPKFWTTFCTGVGLPAEMSGLMPGPHQIELRRQVAEIFRQRTRDEWATFAAERDCCLEPVLEPDELRTDPHIASRDLLFEIPSPRGPVPQFRLPITPQGASFSPPPRSGEHTREILREAGLTDADIDALIASGAARQG